MTLSNELNYASNMKRVSIDAGKDSEHNDVRFVEISEICATKGAFSYVIETFDRV